MVDLWSNLDEYFGYASASGPCAQLGVPFKLLHLPF